MEEGEFDNIDIYTELFQIEMTATTSEISKKYRKLSLKCHPDLFPDDAAKGMSSVSCRSVLFPLCSRSS